jgi:hypothetical protein
MKYLTGCRCYGVGDKLIFLVTSDRNPAQIWYRILETAFNPETGNCKVGVSLILESENLLQVGAAL